MILNFFLSYTFYSNYICDMKEQLTQYILRISINFNKYSSNNQYLSKKSKR